MYTSPKYHGYSFAHWKWEKAVGPAMAALLSRLLILPTYFLSTNYPRDTRDSNISRVNVPLSWWTLVLGPWHTPYFSCTINSPPSYQHPLVFCLDLKWTNLTNRQSANWEKPSGSWMDVQYHSTLLTSLSLSLSLSWWVISLVYILVYILSIFLVLLLLLPLLLLLLLLPSPSPSSNQSTILSPSSHVLPWLLSRILKELGISFQLKEKRRGTEKPSIYWLYTIIRFFLLSPSTIYTHHLKP